MARNGNFAAVPDGRPGLLSASVVLCGFVALLCWWIGITGYMMVGGPASGFAGLLVFLAVPTLATAGTYLAVRRRRAG
jgi:hypothetical protein